MPTIEGTAVVQAAAHVGRRDVVVDSPVHRGSWYNATPAAVATALSWNGWATPTLSRLAFVDPQNLPDLRKTSCERHLKGPFP
jgi:hypothetical protein